MGRSLVPTAMVAAMLALATAALVVGLTPYQPAWWRGALSLAVLGGIMPLIFAVNLRILPVFSRRAWPARTTAPLAMGLTLAGSWTGFIGVVAGQQSLVVAGNALAGGILFTIAFARLFRQPVTLPAPPLPYPGQTAVDRIATRFMRLSGPTCCSAPSSGWRSASGDRTAGAGTSSGPTRCWSASSFQWSPGSATTSSPAGPGASGRPSRSSACTSLSWHSACR